MLNGSKSIIVNTLNYYLGGNKTKFNNLIEYLNESNHFIIKEKKEKVDVYCYFLDFSLSTDYFFGFSLFFLPKKIAPMKDNNMSIPKIYHNMLSCSFGVILSSVADSGSSGS